MHTILPQPASVEITRFAAGKVPDSKPTRYTDKLPSDNLLRFVEKGEDGRTGEDAVQVSALQERVRMYVKQGCSIYCPSVDKPGTFFSLTEDQIALVAASIKDLLQEPQYAIGCVSSIPSSESNELDLQRMATVLSGGEELPTWMRDNNTGSL